MDLRKQYETDPVAEHMRDSKSTGDPEPVPTLLLTTSGCKSGVESIVSLVYREINDCYVVVASNEGAQKHPVGTATFRCKKVTVQVSDD